MHADIIWHVCDSVLPLTLRCGNTQLSVTQKITKDVLRADVVSVYV